MSKKIFGENLKYLMKKKGLSTKDVAVSSKVCIGTVGHWRRGKVYPRMDEFIALCDLLDYHHLGILTVSIGRKQAG